jgi:HK97 gp10 family phage protein
MANASVERFRKLTDELKREVFETAIAELNTQGEKLRKAIEDVAPRDRGVLAHTVRKIAGDKPTQIRIVAGGRETVRPGVSSRPYDYARADEFGTAEMQARPFFFPTYRLMKRKIIAAMKRRITANIKKRSAA